MTQRRSRKRNKRRREATIDQPLASILLADLHEATRHWKTPYQRRTFVRTAFAGFEGMLWSLKLFLLSNFGSQLAPEEIPLLKERQHVLRDSGSIGEQTLHIGFAKNVKFTLGILKRLRPDLDIDFQDPGWQQLLSSLKVRHRLTHPKTSADLDVSRSDLEAGAYGYFWFTRATKVETLHLLEELGRKLQRLELLSRSPNDAQHST